MQDQQGRIVCMGDEYLSQVESGYFHTVSIDTDIHSTITFQLVKEIKFRIRDAQTACKVRSGDCFVTVKVGRAKETVNYKGFFRNCVVLL